MTRRVKIDIIEKPLPSNNLWRESIKVGSYTATFEAWGLDIDDDGPYSVAIVVLDDGRVELVDPKYMRFIPDRGPL